MFSRITTRFLTQIHESALEYNMMRDFEQVLLEVTELQLEAYCFRHKAHCYQRLYSI